jgi:hypothetical protein
MEPITSYSVMNSNINLSVKYYIYFDQKKIGWGWVQEYHGKKFRNHRSMQ